MFEDQVCLRYDSCAQGVKVLGVIETADIPMTAVDGILGLSPTNSTTKAELLINELFKSG